MGKNPACYCEIAPGLQTEGTPVVGQMPGGEGRALEKMGSLIGRGCLDQLIKCPTSTQVMISRFVSSSPASGSVLTAQSLEPASDTVSSFLSVCPPSYSVSLCPSKMHKFFFKKFQPDI